MRLRSKTVLVALAITSLIIVMTLHSPSDYHQILTAFPRLGSAYNALQYNTIDNITAPRILSVTNTFRNPLPANHETLKKLAASGKSSNSLEFQMPTPKDFIEIKKVSRLRPPGGGPGNRAMKNPVRKKFIFNTPVVNSKYTPTYLRNRAANITVSTYFYCFSFICCHLFIFLLYRYWQMRVKSTRPTLSIAFWAINPTTKSQTENILGGSQ